MIINDLIVDGVKRIYAADGMCVGIVKAHKQGFIPLYYVGAGAGENEKDNIKNILERGRTYDRLDWITEF